MESMVGKLWQFFFIAIRVTSDTVRGSLFYNCSIVVKQKVFLLMLYHGCRLRVCSLIGGSRRSPSRYSVDRGIEFILHLMLAYDMPT